MTPALAPVDRRGMLGVGPLADELAVVGMALERRAEGEVLRPRRANRNRAQ